jgi:putative MFS transporter
VALAAMLVDVGVQPTAEVVAQLERMPISFWHVKARVVVGIATFFDAYCALAIAYVLPVIIPLFHMGPKDVGILASPAYVGQLTGTLLFG